MNLMIIARVVLMAIIIFAIYYYFFRSEGFANKTEKANFLRDWFKNNENSLSYESYKSQVAEPYGSNILEYKDIKQLKKNNLMDINNIEKVITL